jgi:hypothetical protein
LNFLLFSLCFATPSAFFLIFGACISYEKKGLYYAVLLFFPTFFAVF